jgi:hypothetical protein
MKGLEIEEKERKTESLRMLRHQFSDVAGKSPSPIGWELTHVQPVPEAVFATLVRDLYRSDLLLVDQGSDQSTWRIG